jgi:hypothetical protein
MPGWVALIVALIRRATGPEKPAIRSATCMLIACNSSSGTTRDTRPTACASLAASVRPVSITSMATCFPATLANLWMPPAPDIAASVISGCMKRADSAASTTSHISTSSQPPPAAMPLTATTTGFFAFASSRTQPTNPLDFACA